MAETGVDGRMGKIPQPAIQRRRIEAHTTGRTVIANQTGLLRDSLNLFHSRSEYVGRARQSVLVPGLGVEPRLPQSKCGVLPLDDPGLLLPNPAHQFRNEFMLHAATFNLGFQFVTRQCT